MSNDLKIPYCTYEAVRQELGSAVLVDDTEMLANIMRASRRLDGELTENSWPLFGLTEGARPYWPAPRHVNRKLQWLFSDFPLRDPTALTIGTADWLGRVDYEPALDAFTFGQRWSMPNPLEFQKISVTGTWGWGLGVKSTSAANETIANPLADTLDISVSATATFQGTWEIDVGRVIKLGDEFMVIENFIGERPGEMIAGSYEVRVRRGAMETTPEEHAAGTAISVLEIPVDVVRTVARQAALYFTRRGGFTQTEFEGMGVTTTPPDLLPETHNLIDKWSRRWLA